VSDPWDDPELLPDLGAGLELDEDDDDDTWDDPDEDDEEED
jgi:hypothetical protein